jgi:hypothetical protein
MLKLAVNAATVLGLVLVADVAQKCTTKEWSTPHGAVRWCTINRLHQPGSRDSRPSIRIKMEKWVNIPPPDRCKSVCFNYFHFMYIYMLN